MKDDINLELWRCFQAVYRSGTVTGAAGILGLSQPAVTAQLRALEQRAGRRLFVRGPRGCTPTPAATELARRLEDPLARLAEISASLGDTVDLSRRTLRLAGPAEFVQAQLAEPIAKLSATGMTVHISLGLAAELLDELARGDHDLVVSTVRPPNRFHAAPLTDEEFVLVAAPQVAAGIDSSRLATDPARVLRAVPVISYAVDQPIVRRWWRHVFGRRVGGAPAVVVADLRAVTSLVAAGAGISVLPYYLCANDITAGRLCTVMRVADAPINTLYTATMAATRHQPHVDTAWRLLHAHDYLSGPDDVAVVG